MDAGDLKEVKDKVRELTDMLEDRKQVRARACMHACMRGTDTAVIKHLTTGNGT